MTRRRPLRAHLLTLGIMLTWCACGSGTSGFQPREEEQRAILSSAAAGTCQIAPGGLEVCAMSAGPGQGAVCDTTKPGCRFVAAVELQGLQPGTSIIGAVEPQDLSLPWHTSLNSLGPANDAGEINGNLTFVTAIPRGTIALRALLIYPPGKLPPTLGTDGIDVDRLASLNAARADILTNWSMR